MSPSLFMTYEKMKAKEKQLIRQRAYFSYLLISLSRIFKWSVPDEVDPRFLEKYLHCTGSFGVKKQGEKFLICEMPARSGQINDFGLGTDALGVTGNGTQISGKVDEDFVICYNNMDFAPDLDLIRYTDGFSQVDKSIMANVRWSILAPALCAKDGKTADAISKLVDDMLDGKIKCITSEDVLASLNGDRGQGVYSVDITHPERIKNVQYQSELYDVLLRRFFNKYGLNIQNSAKHAQASTDEVHGLDAVSWVLVLDMLDERKKACDAVNRIWGGNWSVDFNEPWKSEYERFLVRNKQEDIQDEKSMNIEGSEGDAENVDDTGNDSSRD